MLSRDLVHVLWRLALRLMGAVVALLIFGGSLKAQRIDIDFGKNRVQHHDDFKYWNMYESEHFILYYYGKSRNVAESAIVLAEYDHDEIVNILEYNLRQKIELVVYLDVRDLHQSNLGVDEELFESAGKTHILGNKLFVYFDGNHHNLRDQVRRGIASVYLNSLLYGSSIQERVQDAVSLELPQWYKQGLIEYIVSPWDFEREAYLREFFGSDQSKDFIDLSSKNPKLAGHSFWYFVSRRYGHSSLARIVYRMRTSRNMRSSFDHVLNISEAQLMRDWSSFYTQYFEQSNPVEIEDVGSSWASAKYPQMQQLAHNKNGDLLFSTNEYGKTKVYLLKNGEEKPKKIWKSGLKTSMIEVDYQYPLVDFSPNGREALIIYENRNKIHYRRINLETDEYVENFFPEKIQRVLDLDFYDKNRFLLSVLIDGYSEIIEFTPQNRQYKRYTSDYHDDRTPRRGSLGEEEGIFFASNRAAELIENQRLPKGVIPSNHSDIYFLKLEEPRELYQITNTPFVNESHPRLSGDTLYYLSDKSGVQEVYALRTADLEYEENLYLRSSNSLPSFSNIDFSGSSEEMMSADLMSTVTYDLDIDGRPLILSQGLEEYILYPAESRVDSSRTQIVSPYRPLYNYWKQEGHESNEDFHPRLDFFDSERKKSEEQVDQKVSPPQNQFVTRFGDHARSILKVRKGDRDGLGLSRFPMYKASKEEIHDFRPVRATAYPLSFSIVELSTRFNNDPLFGGLNTFAGLNDEFEPQQTGLLLRGKARDVFEDYEIEMGARFLLTFDGAEYYVSVSDRSKLIDKKYSLYRRSQQYNTTISNTRQERTREVNYIGVAEFRYPFDFFSSLRAIATVRWDQQDPLSLNELGLNDERSVEQRIGLRLEYVYDNTLNIDLNQRHGTRAKAFAEVFNRFDLGLDGDRTSLSEGVLNLVGFDARHYEGFLKHSILALRVTAAHSFGSEKILFHAGGVENWMFNSFDNSVPIPAGENFAYRTTVSNLRGFQYNVRSGNTYGLASAELRIPVFKYLSRNPLRSPFLRSFMMMGFVDAGSSWFGLDPFDDSSPQFTVIIDEPNNPVSVEARFFRQPFVYGYGLGARVLLFGYHVKLDYGWGVDNGIRNDGRLYFSIGLDF